MTRTEVEESYIEKFERVRATTDPRAQQRCLAMWGELGETWEQFHQRLGQDLDARRRLQAQPRPKRNPIGRTRSLIDLQERIEGIEAIVGGLVQAEEERELEAGRPYPVELPKVAGR